VRNRKRGALIGWIATSLLAWPVAAMGAEPIYQDLVARAEAGDATLDYTALRLSYAQSDSYDPYARETADLFSAAWNVFQAKDCVTVLAKTQALLKINYVSIPMHMVRSDCLAQSGDKAGANRELAIGQGLAHSLLASGDGKSTATAYVVVTLSEEGFVLSDLGFNKERQSLVRDGDHFYDLLDGHDAKTGEARSALFNIDALFVGMARQLTKPAAK